MASSSARGHARRHLREHRVAGLGDRPARAAQPGEIVVVVDGHGHDASDQPPPALPRDHPPTAAQWDPMTAQLLAGAPVAESVLADVTKRVEALADRGRAVGLGTILVGEDAASAGYVRKKHETSEQVGVASHHIEVSGDGTQADLLAAVERFNADPGVDAYLIQHPVPRQFDFNAAVEAMDPAKDGDGLHPVNLGKLVLQEDGPVPATPAGIREMFVHYGIDIAGKHVVVCGRGPTLGRPLALLLTLKQPGANAAVTVVHSGVPDLVDYTRQADILVAAVGVPSFVMPDMVRPGRWS